MTILARFTHNPLASPFPWMEKEPSIIRGWAGYLQYPLFRWQEAIASKNRELKPSRYCNNIFK